MATTDRHFRLANEPRSLGLSCKETGLALAGVPLLHKTATGFAPRPVAEIKALIKGAYGRDIDGSRLSAGLGAVAEALNRGRLGRATIAALHLRLPALNWDGAARIAKADNSLTHYNPVEPRDWHGRWTADGEAKPDSEAAPSSPSLEPATTTDAFNSDLLIPAAYNGFYHDQVVADFAAYLQSKGEIVQTEVRLAMADGSAGARIDILSFDPHTKIVYGVEVKTGENPGFTLGQLAVYPHLMLGGSVVGLDSKIVALGLTPYAILRPIPIYLMLKTNRDSEPITRPIDPNKMSRYYRGFQKRLIQKLLSGVIPNSLLERPHP